MNGFFPQSSDRIMPPTFTKSLKRVDGNIGNNASLDCKVSGSQPMTIAWFKDDQEITPGPKFLAEFRDHSATLQIAGLEKADSGVYKCRATNSAGFKETSGTLYVKGCECSAYGRPLCCVSLKWFNANRKQTLCCGFQSPHHSQ